MKPYPKPKKKKHRKKKRRPSERMILKSALDEIVGKIVKQRDGWQCVQCGTRERPTKGHVLVCSVYGVRWDLMNVFCQCAGCNNMHRFQAHLYINWFQNQFGMDEWKALLQRAEAKPLEKCWKVPEMRELLAEYEDLYERLQELTVYGFEAFSGVFTELTKMGAYGAMSNERINHERFSLGIRR